MNKLLSRTVLILMFSLFPYFNYAMELQSVEKQKPIVCDLYIDSSNRTVVYAGKDYIKCITDNSNIVTSINIPLIPIRVRCLNEEGEWNRWNHGDIPKQLYTLKLKQYKEKLKRDILSSEEVTDFEKKVIKMSFFGYLPMTFLLGAETNSVLQCEIYGYPVQLQCNSDTKVSFEQQYVNIINRFVNKVCFLTQLGNIDSGFCEKGFETSIVELLENKVIMSNIHSIHSPYLHGENSAIPFLKHYVNNKDMVNKIILLLSLVKSLEQTE